MTANTPPPPKRRRIRHRRCKLCDTVGTWGSPISARGMCGPCGEARHEEEVRQLRAKQGPEYQKWRLANLRAALEAMGPGVLVKLPNEMPESPGRIDVDGRNLA